MSVSSAETYARRAKNAADPEDAIQNLVKAINELAGAIKDLETEVSRIKRR
ncbi:hypothetical protein [Bradyrhizobium elkanii]|uniref:Uncharacterized protein n=1 Tax=Bradyrhizobium elkanii TaxID=29448 RepID=A0A8I1Y9J8_BRAEL|nr:hypothetical protein [Bradyrhizobium elkanii]MBP1297424.1 hypothetical protein [Bradyrhizobium elkanii]